MKKKKESVYKWFEEHFPEHLIIQKEGFMYSVHGLSANALGTIMEYKIVESFDGRAFTGGPDIEKIMNVLKAEDFSFLVIEKGKPVSGHTGRSPFSTLGILQENTVEDKKEEKAVDYPDSKSNELSISVIKVTGTSAQLNKALFLLKDAGLKVEIIE